jgi:hypothetical protein
VTVGVAGLIPLLDFGNARQQLRCIDGSGQSDAGIKQAISHRIKVVIEGP